MLKKGAIIPRSKGAIIYCPQERWRQQASDQFKQTEQFYSLSLYWNGGFVSSKETTFAKRQHVQSGSKGCLVPYTYPSEFIEEITFQMERFSLSIPLPLFRIIPSPIGVYKTTYDSYSLVKKNERETDFISRRYFADDSIKGRIRDREGHINSFITKSRMRNQCQKVFTLTKKYHRITQDYNNLIKMELSLSEEKVRKILMRCQKTLNQKLVSVREVSQLIETLSSVALAILQAPLQYC